jgi:F0F1-type ATP synthase epsilon subunit
VQYEGQADSVSAVNQVGPFDILEEHEWFVSQIDGEVVVKHREKVCLKSNISRGMCVVKNNIVTIYTD